MRPAAPNDIAGYETLETMAKALQYARWQVAAADKYLGRRVCEIGSGIGNISEVLLQRKPDLLLLTDTDAFYRSALGARFAGAANVGIDTLTLPFIDESHWSPLQLDTVIAFNVIEHIEQDLASVAALGRMVALGGHVVILIPAIPALFGAVDVALEHKRRYTRASASALIENAGLTLVALKWFNVLGILGWWVSSRIVRRKRLPRWQVALFDILVPVLRCESFFGPPIGMSLIAVGRRDV